MGTFRFSLHAQAVCRAKRFHPARVLDAALNPEVAYESHRHPGQHKHIKGDLCVVVNRKTQQIITVFLNIVETDLRPDQIAAGVTR